MLAYLAYQESGNAAVFEGIAQDALVMNIDDLLCVGALGPYLYSNTIGRHARRLNGAAPREIPVCPNRSPNPPRNITQPGAWVGHGGSVVLLQVGKW